MTAPGFGIKVANEILTDVLSRAVANQQLTSGYALNVTGEAGRNKTRSGLLARSDAGPEAVIDRETVELVLDEPAVAVTAHGRPDDVRGVGSHPRAERNVRSRRHDLQDHGERATGHAGERVLERVPP